MNSLPKAGNIGIVVTSGAIAGVIASSFARNVPLEQMMVLAVIVGVAVGSAVVWFSRRKR